MIVKYLTGTYAFFERRALLPSSFYHVIYGTWYQVLPSLFIDGHVGPDHDGRSVMQSNSA